MNTFNAKYSGPLAALTEFWVLEGSPGDFDRQSGDGEGTVLWDSRVSGLFELTYAEARYLRSRFDCTPEELDALADSMALAEGIVYGWFSEGWVYAFTIATVPEVDDAIKALEAPNPEMQHLNRAWDADARKETE